MNERPAADTTGVARTSDLLVVVGARPNFMKAASILPRRAGPRPRRTLLHTGQHYDAELSRIFFEELELPSPTSRWASAPAATPRRRRAIMLEFEARAAAHPARRVVVVVGDVNSTLACALVAVKEHYPVAHVEAGLRCYDPWMPEEINRRV